MKGIVLLQQSALSLLMINRQYSVLTILPSGLVDLSMLEEWKLIRFNEDKSILEIGSLVTHAKLEEHPLIKQFCPALSMAASVVGSPQIRNRGTVAGNLQSASPAADCAPPLLAVRLEWS
ncbi:FAD binding domain-containing protein [Paradesulfitobacterium ferrireducens]|uniref:FAD binding domain-containing protein n=1 Tax=Paradesulfitobacterium ferrireducens TaxID=2816476 RepID=UPI0038B28CDF